MENVTDSPLEVKMIRYAVRPYSKVYEMFGWNLFKLDHKCGETATELYTKFWDDIIPNMNSYAIVHQDDIAFRLLTIPVPNRTLGLDRDIPIILGAAARREEVERMERNRLKDPALMAFKNDCLNFIKQMKADTVLSGDTTSSSVPGVNMSVDP